MHKTSIIVSLSVLSLIGLLGGVYIINQKPGAHIIKQGLAFNTVQEAINSKKNLTCTFKQNISGKVTTSIFYISASNVKEEITTTIAKEYILITPSFTYIWNSLAPGIATVPANLAQQTNATLYKSSLRIYTCTEGPLPSNVFAAPQNK